MIFGSRGGSILNRRYLHLDEGTLYRVIGLVYLEDPERYAGGSVATGRVSLAGQDEGERSDEERYPGPPGWGVEALDQHSNTRKNVFLLKTIHQSLGTDGNII